MGDVTRVGVHREAGRVRCDLHPGALSPRVLSTGAGVARVALVATRALLLGGDRVRVEVHVGEGVELELVEVSGTVAYTGRGRAAWWDVAVRVDAGGLLVWDALPFVVADGADVERSTHVSLAAGGPTGAGGVALLRETLVLGRSGEAGGRVRSRTRVELSAPHDAPRSPGPDTGVPADVSVPHDTRVISGADTTGLPADVSVPHAPRVTRGADTTGEFGAPRGSDPSWRSDPARPARVRELFVEDLDLGDDRALPGILGEARVVDSVLCVGTRPPAALEPAPQESPRRPGLAGAPLRLDLDGPGAIARHLGASTHDAGIDAVVATWTRAVRAVHAPSPDSRAAPADAGSTTPDAPSSPTDRPTAPDLTLLTTGA